MRALITGGGGFLGGAIARLLKRSGHEVRSLTRTAYPWLDELGFEQVLGDLADNAVVENAVAGMDVVFHVAAKAGVWGRHREFYTTNVLGTRNVIAACRKHAVRKLIYTSTPSVVHTGSDISGGNESLPYALHFSAAYPETKAVAEKEVLAANCDELATVALRPHLIWGPGDPHLIPRILARARAGKLRRIGSRSITVDVTYIDNAADAHVQAAEVLDVGSTIAGRAYFISNGEPIDLWAFINQILAAAGLPPVTKSVSVWKANVAARVLEWVYRILPLSGEPPMTRFVVEQLSTSHWFDITAARRDFGYQPRISIEEGLRRMFPSTV